MSEKSTHFHKLIIEIIKKAPLPVKGAFFMQ